MDCELFWLYGSWSTCSQNMLLNVTTVSSNPSSGDFVHWMLLRISQLLMDSSGTHDGIVDAICS
ncbi:hypothetical protein HanXRQr2_Chr07g0282131 [Helianthus annuus]|uniref:Uncharacterized protein n=1 Tax=Helianthus annuus TaxID=4232 RepID=A0A9K3IJ91_HELAN|nr:hypothetical protein HanXRQr2_Chr07g0282131 [Helianthus annuus]